MLAVIGVDLLHNELGAFQPVQLLLELFDRCRVIGTDPAHAGAAYLIQQPLNIPPFLHVAVSGPVLFFLFSYREVGRSGDHHRGNPRVNGKALVHVFGQLAGVGVQQMVDLLMVHGVHPGFLLFGYGGGLIHHCPVFRRCAPFLVVGKAVHFLCPAGGSFIDRVIVDGMHLLHASGHAGPKSYRSSWEGPALSFFGAGGAS